MIGLLNIIKKYWYKKKVSCIKCGKKYTIYDQTSQTSEINKDYNLYLCSSHCFFNYYSDNK